MVVIIHLTKITAERVAYFSIYLKGYAHTLYTPLQLKYLPIGL